MASVTYGTLRAYLATLTAMHASQRNSQGCEVISSPSRVPNSRGESARLLFLRIDRGELLWNSQLALIRSLLTSASGSLYCYSHLHNLDTPLVLRRLAQLCAVVGAARDRGKLSSAGFSGFGHGGGVQPALRELSDTES